MLQPTKRGGKRSGRGRRATLETKLSFSTINAQRVILRKWWWTVGDIFNELVLTATLIEIDSDHWITKSSRNCYNYQWAIFPLQCKLWRHFRNSERDLLLLDMMTAWKQQLNYKNTLSSFWKELISVDFITNEQFQNWKKPYSVLWKSTVVLKSLIRWQKEVDIKWHKSCAFRSILKLLFALYLLKLKDNKIKF